MATATLTTTPIEVTVTRHEGTVTLVLTKDEAKTLRAVTSKIGGEPDTSRRKHMNAIARALIKVGYSGYDTSDMEPTNIRFKDSVGI